MSENKPQIFLSHIYEEKEIALKLKALIESCFLNMVSVFVSSDLLSNDTGDKWLNNITSALKNCVMGIILSSSHSVTRPWINFEAGALWVRDIKVIPACHSGISKNTLPIPLNQLNAINLKIDEDLRGLFISISQKLEVSSPKPNFADFISFISKFEQEYVLDNNITEILNKFLCTDGVLITNNQSNPHNNTKPFDSLRIVLGNCLRSKDYDTLIALRESDITEIKELSKLVNDSLMHFKPYTGTTMNISSQTNSQLGNGVFHSCEFTFAPKIQQLLMRN